ncbi:MAG: flagellar assembly peptidoglycan hydrolase FlgJ [Gammaproteobacteria bacterium]|nr:flagellar assembly peptidoglycan hydrolase FlgJ [Gammaproteobacteria bacterium]
MKSAAPAYTDFSALAELKSRAARKVDGSVGEVARQFESLLLQQMVKSMRQASLGDGILDNDQSLFYRDMFDQQLSLHLANSGGMGLAAAIERQLGSGGKSTEPAAGRGIEAYLSRRVATAERPPRQVVEVTRAESAGAVRDVTQWGSEEFVANLWPWACEAAEQIGIEPQALLAQAALETGWGRRGIRQSDGRPSHNLFGIKADGRWQGEQASASTHEYRDGVAVRQRDSFRAYDSYRESFNDYVEFLRSNPRYSQALAVAGDSGRYFTELQKAGYATDPRYAAKVARVMRGPEMREALARLNADGRLPL